MSQVDVDEAGPEADSELQRPARSKPFLALRRLTRVASWTFKCYREYRREHATLETDAARWECAARRTHIWFKGLVPRVGIHVEVVGAAPNGAALFCPNHLGYLDLLALGSVCDPFFVSKADVGKWPVIGHLFNVSEHIGIARGERRNIRAVNEKVAQRLANGRSVCVFLEGTSTGGDKVLPFHASLIQPAIEADVPLVPVALKWYSLNPRVTVPNDIAYWREDHVFAAHAWRIAGLEGIAVRIAFGAPIYVDGRSRKELALAVREHVMRLLEGLN